MSATRRKFFRTLGALPMAVALGRQPEASTLARGDNKHISRLLDQGANLDCRMIEVDPEAGVWNMVRVELMLVG